MFLQQLVDITEQNLKVEFVACFREDSIVQRAQDSQSSAVVKHLHSCPGCVTQPGLIPVLDPKLDDLPFAMSLEICKGTTPPAAVISEASPICELFYFLQGCGTVSVSTPNYPPWEKEVRAGAVLSPCRL